MDEYGLLLISESVIPKTASLSAYKYIRMVVKVKFFVNFACELKPFWDILNDRSLKSGEQRVLTNIRSMFAPPYICILVNLLGQFFFIHLIDGASFPCVFP